MVLIPIVLLSMIISGRLKYKMKKYSKQNLSTGMTGKEIAEKMLNDNGIYDVKVISVKGQLTDHYNPSKKTVNLSESVYNQRNAAAAAVAAHECGHAVQHAKGYEWLKMRSVLVPFVGVSSNLGIYLIFFGLVLMNSSDKAMRHWKFDENTNSVIVSNYKTEASKAGKEEYGLTGIDIDEVLGF